MRKYFDKRIFVTASLGNTHDGNVRMAKKMIVLAKRAKADAVKFQKRNPDLCADDEGFYEPFGKTTYRQYRKNVEFWKDEYDQIDSLCKDLDILWYVGLYDLDSLEWMEKNYSLPVYKIPSCKVTDVQFVKEVAKTKKLVIMSTGMSTIVEVDRAVTTFLGFNRNLILMHCCSVYPAAPGDINLRVMRTLHKHYQLHTGYDSHDVGDAVSLAAVGMGAKAIEKHMTLDRAIKGLGHSMAMEADKFELFVKSIRDIEKALGGAHKKLLDREIPFRATTTGEDAEELMRLERGS